MPGSGPEHFAPAFGAELAGRTASTGVPAGLGAAGLVVAASVVDRIVEPGRAGSFLAARVVCAAVVLALTAVLARVHAGPAGAPLVLAMVVVLQSTNAWMLPRVEHAASVYVLAMCLTMAATALVVDWSWTYAAAAAGTALVAVAVAGTLAPVPPPVGELTTAAAFLTVTGVVTVVGQYVRWRTSLREYRARTGAQSAQAQAEAAHQANATLVATLQTLVRQDPLTGLANRRALAEDLTAAVLLARRQEHTLGVVVLDIDDFKEINDRYGHPTGDRVLQDVADTLRSRLRASDRAARYGGEEFVLVLPDIAAGDALTLVDTLRQQITDAVDIPTTPTGTTTAVTLSAGIALYPQHADTADDLIAAADRAMYAAKAAAATRPTSQRIARWIMRILVVGAGVIGRFNAARL